MTSIEQKLNIILEKLVTIEKRIERIEASCSAMDSHIGFVGRVYGTVRSPLDYISAQVSRLSGGNHQTLPTYAARITN